MVKPDEKRLGIWYEIKVQGELDQAWLDWLNGVKISTNCSITSPPVTVMTVCVPDQAMLRGILNKIWDLNLTLISTIWIDISWQTIQDKENGN